MPKKIDFNKKHQCKDACLYDIDHATSTCKLCIHDESNNSCFCGKVSFTDEEKDFFFQTESDWY